ncbi:hypothetical protein CHISP_3520 [Chitinispirillum alkaliphilum]|nr:hypothetical protein CHISP_3520 [Chitinispirillum alkaliphilum]
MIPRCSLEQKRDLYLQIRDMTVDFLINPTDERFPQLLETRFDLLSEIFSDGKSFLADNTGNPIVEEIRSCIREILELDKRASQYAHDRMNDIKADLSSLNKTGSAAKAYAANIRR